MSKKILYLDMDNVLVDFASAIPRLTRREREQYEGRLDDVPGIFACMEPVDGAVEAFCELAGISDTYILSTAPWENPTAPADKLAKGVSWRAILQAPDHVASQAPQPRGFPGRRPAE